MSKNSSTTANSGVVLFEQSPDAVLAPYAPPIPLTIRPVPSQFGHVAPATSPLLLHFGQTSSPVPGVPGGASSPGAISSATSTTTSSF